MTGFRGFESENDRLARLRELRAEFGYTLADLCTCTVPRLPAHTRDNHDRLVTERQRAYQARAQAWDAAVEEPTDAEYETGDYVGEA